MPDQDASEPDSTAIRVALWRALHVAVDAPPHVLEDTIGLELLAPAEGWRRRPDMDPDATRRSRASIVARARFVEDLIAERAAHGVDQYVILGAGLDTFAQRRPEIASRLRVFEVDRPGPQAWKRRRLGELGFGLPEWLRLAPVDFEAGGSWWNELQSAGFDPARPAVVAAAGVIMYLPRDATAALLGRIATLAPGSTLAVTFMLPLDLVDTEERPMRQITEQHARAAGTPFLGVFDPSEMLGLALEAGFPEAWHVSAAALTGRYFAGRADGLRPSSSEEILVATTRMPPPAAR
jgi:methyltransferase (TIGR00027 family)